LAIILDPAGPLAQDCRQTALDLARALEQDEFEVWLQPQADRIGDICGYEALLRWNRPGRGLVPAADFIPLAEACGLVAEIDAWMLRACCREAGRRRGGVRIAVNVSLQRLAQADFLPLLREIFNESGVSPRSLELELTESAVADPAIAGMIPRIRGLGVTLALDHFGAGVSSLANLPDLSFDRLKLDSSLIAKLKRGGRALAVARAMVDFGRALGVTVLATGVERRAQLAMLREIGCAQFQGRLIAAPKPLADCLGPARGA
jgi:EAL domain-containing protein (putative c-di-GMP-specific phosphodiesterase class I)